MTELRESDNKIIHKITSIVEKYFELPYGSVQIKTRKREIVQARQIAMYFAKSLTKSSLATIGSQIGGKDHATVLHACNTVSDLMDTYDTFLKYTNDIEDKINENNPDYIVKIRNEYADLYNKAAYIDPIGYAAYLENKIHALQTEIIKANNSKINKFKNRFIIIKNIINNPYLLGWILFIITWLIFYISFMAFS